MAERPSLAQYATSIARSLGRAAAARYGSQARPELVASVCDTAFATGVVSG